MTTITMELSQKSIENAVKRLTDYKNRTLQRKIDRIATKAIEVFQRAANEKYGNYAGAIIYSVSSMSTRTSKTWTVSVSSPGLVTRDGEMLPLVVFLEFGTGFTTNEGAEYVDKVPIDVYAGSWSKSHARTYEEWIRQGKDPEKYPYNHQSVQAVFWGMEAMRKYIARYWKVGDEV